MVRISAAFLLELVKTSKPRVLSCEHGVPPDAKPFGVGYDSISRTLIVAYEHESFPEKHEGEPLDEVHPAWTEYSGDTAVQAITEGML